MSVDGCQLLGFIREWYLLVGMRQVSLVNDFPFEREAKISSMCGRGYGSVLVA